MVVVYCLGAGDSSWEGGPKKEVEELLFANEQY